MERNNVEFTIQEKTLSNRRWKEYHFQFRHGKYKEHVANLGVLQIPSCSGKDEEQFIDAVTKAIIDVLTASAQKLEHKQDK